MYEALLERLGLSENEAKIYEMLLFRGESKASDMVPESGLGRANVYNLLTSLVAKGLVTMTAGKQQRYRAAEPTKLTELLEAKRQDALRLEAEFKQELPKLTSTFQLTTGRPAIQVFEGYEGVEEVLFDGLSTLDEILAFVDVTGLTGEFQEINARYVKKRLKLGKVKKIIVCDSPQTRQLFASQDENYNHFTQILFVPEFPIGFKNTMEIYGNKITYITMRDEHQISVMIDDQYIANMHRQIFDFFWESYASKSSALSAG
jgi:sugar-specific transcriptional regulator TrmB